MPFIVELFTCVDCLLRYPMTWYWCYLDTIIRLCATAAIPFSVSDLPPPSSPSCTAEPNGSLWHHNNR